MINEKFQKNMYQENRVVLKDRLPLDMPLCVSIEPTNVCNFKCVMCFHGNNEQDQRAKPLENMDWTIFEKVLMDLREWKRVKGEGGGIKLLKLYSLGEPLLHPQIVDMVREIKNADVADQIEITTNGSLLTRKISDSLIECGLDIIRFSIYGIDDDSNKRITGSQVSVDKIYENIKYLYDSRNAKGIDKPRIFVKMFDAGQECNEHFISRYGSIADTAGIDEIFNMDVGEGRDVFDNYYGEKGKTDHEEAIRLGIYAEKKPCRYPFTHMTIRNDGTVIVCCADWLKELSSGKIMEHSLQEIWESRSLYELRKKMLESKGQCFLACRSCEIPYRDLPEDSLSDVGIEKFDYKNLY